MTEKTAIDDMQGLYSHVSEAYRAGMRAGRDEFYSGAMTVLAKVSVKHERDELPFAFHAAEECCKAVRELKARHDQHRETV